MAQTTIVPFNTLPACALDCGHLYDANGACVPPEKPAGDLGSYASCFCADPRVSPFSAGVDGVCGSGVCAQDPNGLPAIRNWFVSFCSENAKAAPTSGGGSSSGSSSSNNSGGGGDWLSSHWKWVVFIVVMVLGIAGIWVGACIWRRHYLRKKDRQYALGKSLAARTSSGGPLPPGASQRSVHLPRAGLFAPASISTANVYDVEKTQAEAHAMTGAGGGGARAPKKERKKWVVKERT